MSGANGSRRLLTNGVVYLLMLMSALNYLLAAASVANGDFDRIGLPAVMITMEFWANLGEGIGWLLALLLALRGRRFPSAMMVAFLAGMFWFDVLTTSPLDMPLPPGFLYWGSAVAALQLGVARLLLGPVPRIPSAAPHWCLLVLVIFAASLAAYAAVLNESQFLLAGLPAHLAVVHRGVLAAMALMAVVLVLLARREHHMAGWLLFPLAGMWCWQMLTTSLLSPWPGAPVQLLWGPLSVALLLAVARNLVPLSINGVAP